MAALAEKMASVKELTRRSASAAKGGAVVAASAAKDGAVMAAGAAKDGASAAVDKGKTVYTVASEQFYSKKKEFKKLMEIWLKHRIHHQSERLVDLLPGLLKYLLEDPDMPRVVKKSQDRTIDAAWPEFKEEIMWELAVLIDGTKPARDTPPAADRSPAPDCIRAFLRYHIYPYDRTFWGNLRDPVWLVFTIGCLLPISGVYSIFFALIFFIIDLRDEYQLIYYILSFKGCQFLSFGILRTILGFWQYLACVTVPAKDEEHTCEVAGPGMAGIFELIVGGWVLQVVMINVAWAILPWATDKGRSVLQGSINFTHSRAAERAGGHLKYFMIYDAVCFLVCIVALVVIMIIVHPEKSFASKYDAWPVRQAAFACQVVYGYLSVPFFLFMIPFLTAVITHSVPTAYDREGRCCKFIGPPRPESENTNRLKLPELNLPNFESDKLLDKVRAIFTGGQVDLSASPTQLFGPPAGSQPEAEPLGRPEDAA